jgi:Family of unknown function (DUF5681)
MDQESDDRSEDDAVGYRRPPKRTQWQKGQCGNPTRKRKAAARGAAEIIDQLFAKRFKVTENGSPRTASGLEVIITRLISKEIAGDRRAMTVRLKYLAFALRQRGAPETVVQWGPGGRHTQCVENDVRRGRDKMTDYEVGYGRPPIHTRFKKGFARTRRDGESGLQQRWRTPFTMFCLRKWNIARDARCDAGHGWKRLFESCFQRRCEATSAAPTSY